ncbi:MAG: hypothetical protein Q4F75_04835 [Pseudomonadota bacterium]|nr:hypothetical protein [Pseudomonadota bacterium]
MDDYQQQGGSAPQNEQSAQQYADMMGKEEVTADYALNPGEVELSVPQKIVYTPPVIEEKKTVPEAEVFVKPDLPELVFEEAQADADGVALTIPPQAAGHRNAELEIKPLYVKPQGVGVDVLNENFGEDNGNGEIDAAAVVITDVENMPAAGQAEEALSEEENAAPTVEVVAEVAEETTEPDMAAVAEEVETEAAAPEEPIPETAAEAAHVPLPEPAEESVAESVMPEAAAEEEPVAVEEETPSFLHGWSDDDDETPEALLGKVLDMEDTGEALAADDVSLDVDADESPLERFVSDDFVPETAPEEEADEMPEMREETAPPVESVVAVEESAEAEDVTEPPAEIIPAVSEEPQAEDVSGLWQNDDLLAEGDETVVSAVDEMEEVLLPESVDVPEEVSSVVVPEPEAEPETQWQPVAEEAVAVLAEEPEVSGAPQDEPEAARVVPDVTVPAVLSQEETTTASVVPEETPAVLQTAAQPVAAAVSVPAEEALQSPGAGEKIYNFNRQSGIQKFVAEERNGVIVLNDLDYEKNELKSWNLLFIENTWQEVPHDTAEITVPMKQASFRVAEVIQQGMLPLRLYDQENFGFETLGNALSMVNGKIISGLNSDKALMINDFTVQRLQNFEGRELNFNRSRAGLLTGPDGALLYFAGVVKIVIPAAQSVKKMLQDNLKRIAKRYSGSLADNYGRYSAASLGGEFEATPERNSIYLKIGKSAYGWSVRFDNGLVMSMADVREYQLRNGKLPQPDGIIAYGNKQLLFRGCARIVIYQEAEYFSYRS